MIPLARAFLLVIVLSGAITAVIMVAIIGVTIVGGIYARMRSVLEE